MPFAAKKPCAKHGCPKLVSHTDRWCDDHRKDNQRRSSRERRSDPVKRKQLAFYSSKEWRECRAAYLAEYPLCVECSKAGIVTSATVVDHVTEIKAGGDKLDWSNLQSMCKPHHDRKTRHDGGSW